MKGAPALPVPTEATELLRLHRLAQDRRGIQPNSIEKREQYLRAFARWLDPRGLLDASRQDVELFLDKRRTCLLYTSGPLQSPVDKSVDKRLRV